MLSIFEILCFLCFFLIRNRFGQSLNSFLFAMQYFENYEIFFSKRKLYRSQIDSVDICQGLLFSSSSYSSGDTGFENIF
jgi:hypothetical protein